MLRSKKYTRREILKLALYSIIGGGTMAGAGYGYATRIEPNWIDIAEIQITLPNLPPPFSGYRIAQISDIHLGGWMNEERFSRVVDLLNIQNPDSVVITGDFVSIDPSLVQKALKNQLPRIKNNDGVFTVLGNHDHWTSAHSLRKILHGCDVIELNNDVYSLSRSNNQIHICGLDDYCEKQHDLDKLLNKLPQTGCAILLVHEPDYAVISSRTKRFDLQLSGHSHGGQLNIPFLGPPVLPKHSNLYPSGLYEVNGMLLYTNRGVGMIKPYVRFNCRPEISIFTLISPNT